MAKARPLTTEERQAMNDSFRGRHAYRNLVIWQLNHLLGWRITELLSLQIRDVVDQDGFIRDVIQLNSTKVKNKKTYRRHVTPTLRQLLLEWTLHLYTLGYRRRTGPLFPRNHLEPITRHATYAAIRRAKRKAGIRGTVSNHTTRKNFAVDVLRRASELEREGKVPNALALTMKIGHWSTADAFFHYIGSTDETEKLIIEDISHDFRT